MEFLCCATAGYLVGTMNPAYFLGKINGIDIRKKGSGNAGASNALILFGKIRGILCAVFDIAKATFIIWLMGRLFPFFEQCFAVSAVACSLGHIFPFYMGFRGGKGLACLGGMVLAFDIRVFFIMLLLAVVLVIVTKYICFVPISASIAFPIVYGIMRQDLEGAMLLGIMSAVVVFKHVENLKRIREGSEARISMLWNKEKEIERLRDKYTEE